MRKILRIVCSALLLVYVLWLGGTTVQKFLYDIEAKNVVTVYKPLINKTGINIDVPASNNSLNLPKIEKPNVELPKIDQNKEVQASTKKEPNKSTVKNDIETLISKVKVQNSKNENYNRKDWESPVKKYNGVSRTKYASKTSPYLKSEVPFVYDCPYTGIQIKEESKLDYDHIIPLKYVHDHTNWSNEKKNQYSYDQSVGVNVLNSANRSKAAKGPKSWLPDKNVENYCYTWLLIASEWDIPLDKEDYDICVLHVRNAVNANIELKRID